MSTLSFKRIRWTPKPREFEVIQVLPDTITALAEWINKAGKQEATVVWPFDDYPYLLVSMLGDTDEEVIIDCGQVLAQNSDGLFFALEPYRADEYEELP